MADGELSPVSNLRLARRSVGEVLAVVLWGHGLSTWRAGGLAGLGVSHCLIDLSVVTFGAGASREGLGEVVVLEGSGRAAPLGAHVASCGDNRPSRLSNLLTLAGVVSVCNGGAINKKRQKSPRSSGVRSVGAPFLNFTETMRIECLLILIWEKYEIKIKQLLIRN